MAASQHRDALDLDPRILAHEPAHHDAGAARPGWSLEEPAAARRGLLVVVEAQDVVGGLHDVAEPGADALQEQRELAEDVPGLGDDVAGSNDAALLVSRRRAGQEDEIADL